MRNLLLIIVFVISFNSMARERVPSRCQESAEQLSKIDLLFFNKTQMIQHGECVGIALVKRGAMQELPQACSEVVENENNISGPLSLSKKEVLQIGMCLGIINYTYDRYHEEKYQSSNYDSYNSQRNNYTFQCEKGRTAVNILINTAEVLNSREQIRDRLCNVVRY